MSATLTLRTLIWPVTVALNTIGAEEVVLLLGGLDRGLDWSDFARQLALGSAGQMPAAIITMPDNGPKILASEDRLCPVPRMAPCSSLEAARDSRDCSEGVTAENPIVMTGSSSHSVEPGR